MIYEEKSVIFVRIILLWQRNEMFQNCNNCKILIKKFETKKRIIYHDYLIFYPELLALNWSQDDKNCKFIKNFIGKVAKNNFFGLLF